MSTRMHSRSVRSGHSTHLLLAWDSSWVSSWNIIWSLLTFDHYDVVLFIKAYSLKRTTIQRGVHAKPDEETIACNTTTAGPQGKTEEQEHPAIEAIELECKDESEKV